MMRHRLRGFGAQVISAKELLRCLQEEPKDLDAAGDEDLYARIWAEDGPAFPQRGPDGEDADG